MGHTQTIHIEIRSTNTEWSDKQNENPSVMAAENIRTTTIKGLEAGTTYYFRLSASNEMGRSMPSTIFNITTGKWKLYFTVVGVLGLLDWLCTATLFINNNYKMPNISTV